MSQTQTMTETAAPLDQLKKPFVFSISTKNETAFSKFEGGEDVLGHEHGGLYGSPTCIDMLFVGIERHVIICLVSESKKWHCAL
mmetsp:Transcript_2515/g.4441  ORF Transcript_2515/g.4441 Transcript_2515/m.4441 type:complete len:84 (+) Transcript_2515:53-304(+)